MLNLAVWGTDYLKVTFAHDPTSKTRGYVIRLRRPGDMTDTVFGPYGLISIDETKTFPDGASLKRIGISGWEWKKPFDYAANPDGIYSVSAAASGDGGVEGFTSPERPLTLVAKAVFADLLQGLSSEIVQNGMVTTFPLIMRLENFNTSLFYHYTILDGETTVWDSAWLNNAASSRIQATFRNLNNYTFINGKSYRIRVDAFDNNTGAESLSRQKSGEMTFTYSP